MFSGKQNEITLLNAKKKFHLFFKSNIIKQLRFEFSSLILNVVLGIVILFALYSVNIDIDMEGSSDRFPDDSR